MTKNIYFLFEDIKFTLKNKNLLRSWIREAVISESKELGEIRIIFCSDKYLLRLNQRYLKRNTLTDVIAFTDSDEDGRIQGDIFISIPRVRENARSLKEEFQNELYRIIIHGVLHLAGWTDKTEYQRKAMHLRENYYLKLIGEKVIWKSSGFK